jgi:hypothetical protein
MRGRRPRYRPPIIVALGLDIRGPSAVLRFTVSHCVSIASIYRDC